jgi:hypothetical protein
LERTIKQRGKEEKGEGEKARERKKHKKKVKNRTFFEKLERKKTLGTRRRRWKYNIKKDLKTGC